MNNSNLNIVEKLALQVDSFQEGFEVLCGSKSLREMAQQFVVLLRGNFLVTKVNIFHKQSADSKWEVLEGKKDYIPKHLDNFDHSKIQLSYDLNSNTKICITLPLVDKSFVGITIGNRLDRSEFSEFDKITLQIFLQLLHNAYQSFLSRSKEKKLIFELNQRVLQLNNLIDTGIDLAKFENRQMLLELAIQRAAVLTDASNAIFLVKENSSAIEEHTFPPGTESSYVKQSSNTIAASFEYREKEYEIILANKESRTGFTDFTELDKILLEAIVRQVNTAIENDFLHQESVIKERIEKELDVAASIQQRVIPSELPVIPGFDVAGINIPSREVGGDYFDCIELGKNKFALIMADVAGKGIAASLLVNTLNASLYAYLDNEIPLPEMADKLNKIIFKASPPDKFITYFAAILDANTGELDIVNAGHNPIYLQRKKGKQHKIEASGVGLGMIDFGLPYEGEKQKMNPGDNLFLYTDGIPEAMNEAEEDYSDERMEKFLADNQMLSAQEFIDKLVKDVKSFTGNAEQSDDITALMLKRI